jgi:DNA adenine methylase
MSKLQKPFLKWVVGKTQIIDNIISKIPKEINNYHEIFLGGGSVLLALLSLKKSGDIKVRNKIFAYDFNRDLINVYINIRDHRDETYERIMFYLGEYDQITGTEVNRKPKTLEEAKTSKESYYYWCRDCYNKIDKATLECSSLFVFLNKTCFRGMYREGPNGYNVPYGHYKKTPSFIKKEELDTISDLIRDVNFIHSDFRDSIKNPGEGDFVYLDPPYAPENKKSFVGYVSDGFSIEMHNNLFTEIKKLTNIKFVMSNSKVDLVTKSFEEYNCEDVVARRAINSKKPDSTTIEVIVHN